MGTGMRMRTGWGTAIGEMGYDGQDDDQEEQGVRGSGRWEDARGLRGFDEEDAEPVVQKKCKLVTSGMVFFDHFISSHRMHGCSLTTSTSDEPEDGMSTTCLDCLLLTHIRYHTSTQKENTKYSSSIFHGSRCRF